MSLHRLTSHAAGLFRMCYCIISNLCTMCVPGLLDRFVVARHPHVSAHLTAFNIVTNQLLDFLWSPPSDHHWGVRVPDGHWVARGRGQICWGERIERSRARRKNIDCIGLRQEANTRVNQSVDETMQWLWTYIVSLSAPKRIKRSPNLSPTVISSVAAEASLTPAELQQRTRKL